MRRGLSDVFQKCPEWRSKRRLIGEFVDIAFRPSDCQAPRFVCARLVAKSVASPRIFRIDTKVPSPTQPLEPRELLPWRCFHQLLQGLSGGGLSLMLALVGCCS